MLAPTAYSLQPVLHACTVTGTRGPFLLKSGEIHGGHFAGDWERRYREKWRRDVGPVPANGVYTFHGEAFGTGAGSGDPMAQLMLNGNAIDTAIADEAYVSAGRFITLPYSATLTLNAGDLVQVQLSNLSLSSSFPADLNIIQHSTAAIPEVPGCLLLGVVGGACTAARGGMAAKRRFKV